MRIIKECAENLSVSNINELCGCDISCGCDNFCGCDDSCRCDYDIFDPNPDDCGCDD